TSPGSATASPPTTSTSTTPTSPPTTTGPCNGLRQGSTSPSPRCLAAPASGASADAATSRRTYQRASQWELPTWRSLSRSPAGRVLSDTTYGITWQLGSSSTMISRSPRASRWAKPMCSWSTSTGNGAALSKGCFLAEGAVMARDLGEGFRRLRCGEHRQARLWSGPELSRLVPRIACAHGRPADPGAKVLDRGGEGGRVGGTGADLDDVAAADRADQAELL